MTPFDLLVRGTLILPDGRLPGGWIAVRGGTIAAIGTGEAPAAAAVHDAGTALVLPGAVDGQTHATSYKGLAGMAATTRSALAGGITTIVDMPYDNPDPLTDMVRLEAKVAAVEAGAHCDVALYGTVARGQGPGALEDLAKAGICAVKISGFQNHPVRFPRIPQDETLDILEASVPLGLPVGLHNEDEEIVRARVARFVAAGRTDVAVYPDSRPEAAEMAATAAFLELGAATGAHVHIVHFSAPRGYDLVARYRAEGVRATAELCVHYLHFDAGVDGPRLGARMKVGPPIRAGRREGLWAALAAGKVDFVSSDHSSWPIDSKLTPSIFDAGAGIPGLETLVPSFYTDLVARADPDPARTVALLVSAAPAAFFGLTRKGEIRVGADADLMVLEETPVRFDASTTRDGLNWSPYDGETFAVRVAATFVRGTKAWDGADVTVTPGHGRYVPRTRG
ncbi:MAG: dihydroorotase [Rhodospirillales bacterium]